MWRLVVIGVVLIGTPGFAQKCLSPDDCTVQIHVRRVAIRSAEPLIKAHERQTVADIRRLRGDRSNDSWQNNLKDIAEEIVKEAYQNDGYFKAEAQANVTILRSDESHASVDILVTVNPGERYRQGAIRWKGMKRFTAEQLSVLIPDHSGQVFNRQRIVDGLQAVTKLYESVGYLNFTLVPTPDFPDSTTVSFTMDLDEGGEFTLGPVIVSGFTRERLDQLDKSVQPLLGQPFTPIIREQIPSRVSSLAPCAGPPEVQMHMDESARTISYFFDYSDCYNSWLESLDAVPDPRSK